MAVLNLASPAYVDCKASDVLAPGGQSTGYALTVSSGTVEMLKAIGAAIINPFVWSPPAQDDVTKQAATDLWLGISEWSGYAVVQQPPVPDVVGGTATMLLLTSGNAAQLTCGELISRIGQKTSLVLVQLQRVDADQVKNNAAAVRGQANDSGSTANATNSDTSPLTAIQNDVSGALGKIGIGLGVAVAVAAVVLGVVYFKKR